MPEGGQNIGFYEKTKKTLKEHQRQEHRTMQGRLVLHPSNFCIGTKIKPYSNLTVDDSRFDKALEPTDPNYRLRSEDELKLTCKEGKPLYSCCRYLMNTLTSGDICIAKRGKLFAFAVGHHCIVIHWGLEAQLIELDLQLYQEITSRSVIGPNPNRTKANKLRRFIIPPEYKVKGSSDLTEIRYITILAAIIGEGKAWVVADFSRLARFHIISRNEPWTQDDLAPDSKEWEALWSHFGGGYDWQLESKLAEEALRTTWRSMILDNATYHSLPILDLMTTDAQAEFFFSPFGRHLANDALFFVGVLPSTPGYMIVSDDHVFDSFVHVLQEFMNRYHTPQFLVDCCARTTGDNPFAFQLSVDRKYDASYMFVFRKAVVKVPAALFKKLALSGMLDPGHTIGDLYTPRDHVLEPLHNQGGLSVRLPVYYRQSPADFYTIIRARAPEGWNDGAEKDSYDHLLAGYTTTIGNTNFRETKVNKPNVNANLDDVKLPRGRPSGSGKKKKNRVSAGSAGDVTLYEIQNLIKKEERITEESNRLRIKYNALFGYDRYLNVPQTAQSAELMEHDSSSGPSSPLRPVRTCRSKRKSYVEDSIVTMTRRMISPLNLYRSVPDVHCDCIM
ncbi:hypothetical protein BDZ89DRAFT_982264 [Hymenopellis radicata]|nr:hypothetical protein BDZ89DRAFT_982264 [Hymenopellis radicata]